MMATARLNVALEALSGKCEDMLYRRYPHKLVIGPLPDYSKRKRNAKQKACSARFGEAQLPNHGPAGRLAREARD